MRRGPRHLVGLLASLDMNLMLGYHLSMSLKANMDRSTKGGAPGGCPRIGKVARTPDPSSFIRTGGLKLISVTTILQVAFQRRYR